MSHCLNPSCYQVNEINAKFCVKCGKPLLLLERYRGLKVIGQGGFGKTYLAQDEARPSKPRCVIKQFTYSGVGMQKANELFEQEAVQLDELGKHPQIPELFAHGERDGQQFLVQEFIDGQNLAQELAEQGAFTETKIRELLLDLLPVLDFLHKKQVIHRDVKPENIIRRRLDQKLVLVDFGAAKQGTMTILAKTGTTIGSPEYTAPEQAKGKAGFSSDIYSLGVTCLNLMTLCSPFDLTNLDGEWVWRDFLNGNKFSKELGEIIDKSLVPVSRRYESASAMLGALNPFQVVIPTVKSSAPNQAQVISTSSNSKIIQLPNNQVLELIAVDGGSFMMGSPKGQGYDNEQPQHRVNVPSFLIGKFPITQSQYQAVMGINPSDFKNESDSGNRPVEQVSWEDAQAFCKALSQQTGQKVRLPSEAEWEYAARGGNKSQGYIYAGSNNLDEVAWCSNNSNEQTHAVGEKKGNELGIHDMSGNVWEWCEDAEHKNYYGAPTNGSAWITGDTNRKMLRGGSWFGYSVRCRSAFRIRNLIDFRFDNLGFRVVFFP